MILGSVREPLRPRSRRRPRPRLRSHMMEYWSVGVLRQARIHPATAGLVMLKSGRQCPRHLVRIHWVNPSLPPFRGGLFLYRTWG
jgi:hypothetical protein